MNAVIFARCSSSGYQANRQDTTRQVEDLRAYADYAQMNVVKVFEEHISGGKKNDERPVLQEAIDFCKKEKVENLLVSELSRLGRSSFEVMATVKDLVDNGINLYMQKEQLNLLDADGQPTVFAPIMLATLATCAQLERENIKFRLNSGRKLFIERGGKLGRKVGTTKSHEKKEEEYAEIIRKKANPALAIDYGAIPYSDKQVMHLCADISELTQDTGWKPMADFEENITRMLT